MLFHLLAGAGYDVETVSTAAVALARASVEHFDLYLLDSRLPDRNGLALCRDLRELHPDRLILFYSGDAYHAHHELAQAAGATAYVNKPEIDQLLATIKDLLS